ncbi:MAG: hypothetical protein HQL64_05955 [Magnetococcales bacterium]|nr:hypothetical protein [Magnetococcales bacterium]
MGIEDYDHIAIDFWCGADSVKLHRRLPRFFTNHHFEAMPAPLAGFARDQALHRPGAFEQKTREVMERQERLLEKHDRLVVFGIPLLWIAMIRAAGGRVSRSLVERAGSLFTRWDLIIVPGDGVLSPGSWYGEPGRLLSAQGEAWATGADLIDPERQRLVTLDGLIDEMKERSLWR